MIYSELLSRVHARNGLDLRLDGPDDSQIVRSTGDPVDREIWAFERVETTGRCLPYLYQFMTVPDGHSSIGPKQKSQHPSQGSDPVVSPPNQSPAKRDLFVTAGPGGDESNPDESTGVSM